MTIDTTEHDTALLRDAVELVVTRQLGSVSMLQRDLGIGFAHADRLMGELEANGVVGPLRQAKSREVLVKADQFGEVIAQMGLVVPTCPVCGPDQELTRSGEGWFCAGLDSFTCYFTNADLGRGEDR